MLKYASQMCWWPSAERVGTREVSVQLLDLIIFLPCWNACRSLEKWCHVWSPRLANRSLHSFHEFFFFLWFLPFCVASPYFLVATIGQSHEMCFGHPMGQGQNLTIFRSETTRGHAGHEAWAPYDREVYTWRPPCLFSENICRFNFHGPFFIKEAGVRL